MNIDSSMATTSSDGDTTTGSTGQISLRATTSEEYGEEE